MAPSLPPALARAAEAVLPALQQAARRTGVDFEALFHTARLESGFDPAARARTSSAAGLFQFIDSTWLNTLDRHGPRHGISPATRAEALALRTDPGVAALMAAEHMADNAARIERATGRKPGATDLYLAHFLGVGGATRFLSALDRAPETPGVQMFPAAAKANRAIFFDASGAARTLADIRDGFARRLGLAEAPARPSAPPALAAAIARAATSPLAGGTNLPLPGTATGTSVPPDGSGGASRPVAMAARATGFVGNPLPTPRLAAQAAWLLIAELGA